METIEELELLLPQLDEKEQKGLKGGYGSANGSDEYGPDDDFWNDWAQGEQLWEYIGYADGSSETNENFWSDWAQYDFNDNYNDYAGGSNSGGASAYGWEFDYIGLDISATGVTESKMQNALSALGLSTGVQSFNHSTLAQLANLLGAESSTVQLLSKSGTKIGVVGATFGTVNASITLSEAGWDWDALSGEDKEDIAITTLGLAGVGAGLIGGVAAANFWNPVGWVLGGIAVGWAIYDYTQDNKGNTNDVFDDGKNVNNSNGKDGKGNYY